jgi:tetratricopeptide (TPR) repeat protein
VARWFFLLFLLFPILKASPQQASSQGKAAEQEPPEEDESLKPKEYTLNPVQAASDLRVGLYYLKTGKYRAASRRFLEATRWDPGSAEAYLKLGEAQEKMREFANARESYKKYLDLNPDPKTADLIRKKLEKLPVK